MAGSRVDGLVDVVVVGAGLSGLVCARELTRQGLAVQVLGVYPGDSCSCAVQSS